MVDVTSYFTSPQMMFPSILHISEATGTDDMHHPASWHTVFWVGKCGECSKSLLLTYATTEIIQHRNLLFLLSTWTSPDKILPASCDHSSLPLPPWASLYRFHHQCCSLPYTTFSSLSKVSSSQVGRFTGTSDQEVSRWRLYLAKWEIYQLIDRLIPL